MKKAQKNGKALKSKTAPRRKKELKGDDLRSILADDNPDMLFADGLDDALIGIAESCGRPTVAAYSVNKIIKILVSQGMTRTDAREYFSFNIAGAYVGPNTPVFIHEG